MAYKNKKHSKSRARSADSGSPVRFVGILLLTFFFAVLITCVIMGSNIKKQDDTEVKTDSGVTTEVTTTKEETKKEETTTPDTSGVEKNNTQNEGEDPNTLEEITGYVSHTSVSGTTVRIRVVINQLIEGVGTCALTLSAPSGNNLKSTVNTSDGPSSATCEGFDVDVVSFRETGKYIFQIEVNGNGKHGVISGEVDV